MLQNVFVRRELIVIQLVTYTLKKKYFFLFSGFSHSVQLSLLSALESNNNYNRQKFIKVSYHLQNYKVFFHLKR